MKAINNYALEEKLIKDILKEYLPPPNCSPPKYPSDYEHFGKNVVKLLVKYNTDRRVI